MNPITESLREWFTCRKSKIKEIKILTDGGVGRGKSRKANRRTRHRSHTSYHQLPPAARQRRPAPRAYRRRHLRLVLDDALVAACSVAVSLCKPTMTASLRLLTTASLLGARWRTRRSVMVAASLCKLTMTASSARARWRQRPRRWDGTLFLAVIVRCLPQHALVVSGCPRCLLPPQHAHVGRGLPRRKLGLVGVPAVAAGACSSCTCCVGLPWCPLDLVGVPR